MENTVATASRNVLAITRRKFSHYTYRGTQLLLRRGRQATPSTVCLYPAIDDAETLADVLNRLAWYLPERTLRKDVRIIVPSDLEPDAARERTPAGQVDYDTDHLPLDVVPAGSADDAASAADSLLLWDATHRLRPGAFRNITKVEIVDPGYYSGVESYTWGAFTSGLRDPPDDNAAGLFRDLEERAAGYDRSYVFATGPSLDRASDFEFEDDALKVVCNSIVRDEDTLAHVDPDVLVFADPVFHFGPSEYASAFRADAVRALDTHDCLGFVPSHHRSLFGGHYPDVDLVGLSSVDADEPRFPSADDMRVMETNNIMTWFMLPIASALTDEVYVLGADGREENESYFWQHNEDAQYDDDLMATAVEAHPSFFRDRVYADYYERHCRTLSNFLEYGEARGIEYRTLTDSYIECLADRRIDAVATV